MHPQESPHKNRKQKFDTGNRMADEENIANKDIQHQ